MHARLTFIAAIALWVAGMPATVQAEQPKRISQIGFLALVARADYGSGIRGSPASAATTRAAARAFGARVVIAVNLDGRHPEQSRPFCNGRPRSRERHGQRS